MIKVRNLKKTFGPKVAVNGVSFTVEKGEVLGFLGPNGAGKSTTMRMITGFIPPTDGEVTIGGHDIVEHPIPAKRLIGYLPENAPSYTDMTVLGFLSFAAELRGLARRCEEEGGESRGGDVLPRSRAAPKRGDALEGLPAPDLFRAVDHPRSRGADPRRTDGRPRSEPEARGADADPADGREEGDHFLHAHPRGSRGGVLAGDHHRPRHDRRQRHAARTQAALDARRRGDAAVERRRARRR